MNKKMISGIVLASSLLIPVATSVADEMKQYQLNEVTKEIKEKDISRQILMSDDPELSDESKMLQGQFEYRFDKIQDVQEAYTDLQTDLKSELNAYTLAFNYWLVNQQKNLYQENLQKAKNDLGLVKNRKEVGMASDLEVTQAKMNVNKADSDYQDALGNLNKLKYKFNKDLDNDIMEQFKINFANFEELPKEDYEPAKISAKEKETHPALNTPKAMLSTYEFIYNQAKNENLDVNAAAFARYQKAASRAAEIYANNAEKEFQPYYKDKVQEMKDKITEIKDGIEVMSYSYAEQFDRLSNKIKLYEENIQYAEDVYNKMRAMYKAGLKIENDVNTARLGVLQSELALAAAQKEYSTLKEEFRLFQKGYMKQQ